MKSIANAFWSEDEGNGTIDWVVLIAGVVSLGFAVAATLASGPRTVTADMTETLNEADISSGA